MCLNFSRWSWRIPRLFLLLSARPLESTQAAQELEGKQHELLSRLAERGNSVGSLEDFHGLLPPPLPLPTPEARVLHAAARPALSGRAVGVGVGRAVRPV